MYVHACVCMFACKKWGRLDLLHLYTFHLVICPFSWWTCFFISILFSRILFLHFLSHKLLDFSFFPAWVLWRLTLWICEYFLYLFTYLFYIKMTGRVPLSPFPLSLCLLQHHSIREVLICKCSCLHLSALTLSTCFPKNFCWVIIFYTPWAVMSCRKN